METKIYLQNSPKIVLIDESDYKFISQFKWYISTSAKIPYVIGCARLIDNKYYPLKSRKSYPKDSLKKVLLHRIIMNPPKDKVIDHINGDALDNRRSNLRICTQHENLLNRHFPLKGLSGFAGVSFTRGGKRKKRWVVYLRIKGKHTYFGRYFTKEEAARVYDEAVKKHYGKIVRLNFPDNT